MAERSSGRLAGKVAIVTGSAQGQGEAISRAFVAEGAQVGIADVADAPGELLAKELGDAALFVHHDVSAAESWGALVAATAEHFGPVTVLANNAGILRFGEIATQPLEEFELLWRVNTFDCFLGIRSVIAIDGGATATHAFGG